ncbi:MAG: hypothetical protein N2517_00925 [Ignavibacteria bacterium]|nr:hypothetical protein [Ignavibacteria bacterium]
MKFHRFFPFFFFVIFLACQTEGPNELGGDPKTEFSNVGDTTTVFFDFKDIGLVGKYISVDIGVTENNNGTVVSKGSLSTDTSITRKVDTTLGTASLPPQVKKAIREKLIRMFDAKVDSSDKKNIKIDFVIRSKITSKGMQDFIHSEGDLSKPFTLVKYDAKVGDKYEFTDKEGNKFVREVTYRSTTDDYPIAFWYIKVIKVEETITDGPYKNFFGKLIYYTNHKFGVVGLEYQNLDGKKFKIEIWPSNL